MSKVEQKRIDKIKRTIMENPRLVRELMISEDQESLVRIHEDCLRKRRPPEQPAEEWFIEAMDKWLKRDREVVV